MRRCPGHARCRVSRGRMVGWCVGVGAGGGIFPERRCVAIANALANAGAAVCRAAGAGADWVATGDTCPAMNVLGDEPLDVTVCPPLRGA